MPDKKISSLTPLAAGSIATGDLLPVVDISEPLAADKNKNVSFSTLTTYFNTNLSFASTGHNHDADYISIVTTPTTGNFPQLTAGGELVNSAYDETSFDAAGTAASAISTHESTYNHSYLVDWKAGTETGFHSMGIDDNVSAGGPKLTLGSLNHTLIGYLTFDKLIANSSLAMTSDVDNSLLIITGATQEALGSALKLFGGSHATLANDIQFGVSGVAELYYDHSASSWDFQANALTTTGTITGVNVTSGSDPGHTHTAYEASGAVATHESTYDHTKIYDWKAGTETGFHSMGIDDNIASGGPKLVVGADITLTLGDALGVNDLLVKASDGDNIFTVSSYGRVDATNQGTGSPSFGFRDWSTGTQLNTGISGEETTFTIVCNNAQRMTIHGDAGYTTFWQGEFRLPEKAAHNATATSSNGLIWVKNDIPNALMFTNDAGTDMNLVYPAWSRIQSTPTTLSGYGISDTQANFNTALSDGSFAFAGGAFHDGFSDYVANEHINWTNTSISLTTTGTVTGSILVTTSGTVRESATDGSLRLQGANGTATGAMIELWGSTSANPHDMDFDAAGAVELKYDHSASSWDFQANLVTTTGVVSGGGFEAAGAGTVGIYRDFANVILSLSGDLDSTSGANIQLYGSAYTGKLGYMEFRNGSTITAQYAPLISTWDFQANAITTTGTLSSGNATFPEIMLTNTFGEILKDDTTGAINIAAGTDTTSGANILLHGSAYLVPATSYDMAFRTATTTRLRWDHSELAWDFNAQNVYGMAALGINVTGTLSAALHVEEGDIFINKLGTSPTGSQQLVFYATQDSVSPWHAGLTYDYTNEALTLWGGGASIDFDNNVQVFNINDVEEMRLTSTGLGIGRTPTYALDISHAVGQYSPALRVQNTTTVDSWGRIDVIDDAGNTGMLYQINNTLTLRTDVASSNVTLDAQGNVLFLINHIEQARIDSNGRLGIGEQAPDDALHVKGSGNICIRMEGTRPLLRFHEIDGNANENFQLDVDGGIFHIQNNNDTFSGAVSLVHVNQAGRMSIGSYQNTYPLSVYGSGNQQSTVWSSASNGSGAFIARAHGTGQGQLVLAGGGQTPYTSSFELIQDSSGHGYLQNRHSTGHIYLLTNGTLRGLLENTGGLRLYGVTSVNRLMQQSPNQTYYNQLYSNLSDSANYGFIFNIQNSTAEFKMTNSGSFDISESGAQSTPGAGYGRLWVKNDTPNVLYFTNDAATSIQVSMSSGTYSPQLWDASNSGSEGQTYSQQDGRWWRIGNLCYVQIDIGTTSTGTLTGGDTARITLPFSASDGNYALVANYGSGLAITAGHNPLGRVISGAAYAVLDHWTATTGTGGFTITEWSANGRMMLSGWYRVN